MYKLESLGVWLDIPSLSDIKTNPKQIYRKDEHIPHM